MARRFVGSRVFGSSSDDQLFIEQLGSDLVAVYYQPSAEKLELSDDYAPPTRPAEARRKLLEVGGPKRYLSIYPINTLPTHRDFLKPKYARIESMILAGFNFDLPTSVEEVQDLLEALPSGFVKDFSYGLGLVKDYKPIIDAIEEIPQIKHLVISQGNETAVAEEFYTLNSHHFDTLRRGMNRIASRQQSDALQDKRILAHNSLLSALDPRNFPEKSRPYKKDTIFKLIPSDGQSRLPLSSIDQAAAVHLIDQNKRQIAEKAPEQLLRLRKEIELVTLEVLIDRYQEMLTKELPESRWQALFNENPFILNLAFGYPVIKIEDQAHVGGQTLSGGGGTITDFLVKNRLTNNAALFEIKTPGAPLLNKTPYRGQLYSPSSELSGAINQMLDQRKEFQKDIARIKENSRIYDLESYSVHGVLVIGSTPEGDDRKKSFELFRANSKDIAIVTFDELLAKLRMLHEFLVSSGPEAQQAAALHRLETEVVRLEHSLHGLFEYSESKSGSIRIGSSAPKSGVDGKGAMTMIARLAILKQGFDRARLQIPPYPVAFDESGNATVKVQTLDELISCAGKTIQDASGFVGLQPKHKKQT